MINTSYRMRLRQSCRVEAVEGVNDPRRIVVREVACSYPYPAGRIALEKAGLGPETQAMLMYTAVPDVDIETGYRVIVKEHDLRVQHVSKWPEVEPVYIELVVQAESD